MILNQTQVPKVTDLKKGIKSGKYILIDTDKIPVGTSQTPPVVVQTETDPGCERFYPYDDLSQAVEVTQGDLADSLDIGNYEDSLHLGVYVLAGTISAETKGIQLNNTVLPPEED